MAHHHPPHQALPDRKRRTARAAAAAWLAVVLPLTGCGPVSLAQAERECLHQARLAQQPRGSVGIGMDSAGKVRPVYDITISSDYVAGRDPSQVYDSCVMRRSGQMPSRPFTSIPAQR